MKKIIGLFIAMLLIASVAGAHQLSSDPSGAMTTQFPAVYVDVYNDPDNADALAAGEVVVYDIDASSGDNDFWVATTTTADTGVVAGVVWPNAIAVGGTGTIVIYGMAQCTADGGGVSSKGLMCTSTTAGAGKGCAATNGAGSYATPTAAIGASATGKCFVDIK